MQKNLVIIGAGGHGKVVSDIAVKNGYETIIFLDDNDSIHECAGFPVIGNIKEIKTYNNWDTIVAIGNPQLRRKVQNGLEEYRLISLIHPNAVISRRVSIGNGTVIMAGTVINSDTCIGNGCIINTSSSIDHDCIISDFCHVSVGAHIAGNVSIGEETWIGIGASVSNNAFVCERCMIGAGAVVIRNIVESGTYIGVPAERITNESTDHCTTSGR